MPVKFMPMCVLLLPFLCAACNNRGQSPGSTVSAPNKGPDRPAVPQPPSIPTKSPPTNPVNIPQPHLGATPAKNPAAEWALQTAKRLEKRRFENVDLLRRAGAKMPPETLKEWGAALDQVTEQKAKALTLYQVILKFSPIWKGEEFLPTESQKMLARVKQLPKDVVSKWSDGFGTATGGPVEELLTVLMLIQVDYLYEAERFRAVRAAQLLPRLRSLRPELLQPWADALGDNTLGAAVELIDNDWLFENDRLKASASEEALQALRAARSVPK